MKKVILSLIVASVLVACNNGGKSEVVSDSTAVDSTKVDTTAVSVDTTHAVVADTTKK